MIKQNNSVVYIEKRECFSYPESCYRFAPSEKYPEYMWDDISPQKNEVYDIVRSALYGYGLDCEHFGTKQWNPFCRIINKGDTVLIKPNWVMHKNENHIAGMDCLFTHTSIVRAIVDYVVIALGGTGRIILADSPMPSCDFDQFQHRAGIEELRDSLRSRNIEVEIEDLRGDVVKTFSKNRIAKDNTQDGIEIDIGQESWFAQQTVRSGDYRYSFLDAEKMNTYYHTKDSHRYVINRYAIEADVIINIPKIKTHRKAGYTAALKNYIGICYKKDAIPHFIKGNQKQGGDEYNGPDVVFGTESAIRDRENYYQNNHSYLLGLVLKGMRIPFWAFRRIFASRYQGVGNWNGNDTIWRAVLDINRIIYYADKQGNLRDKVQRRFFTLGDMIVAGQKNGPLAPTPREYGCILCSEDPVAFDLTTVALMGFDYRKIPLFKGLQTDMSYPLPVARRDTVTVRSCEKRWNGTLSDIQLCERPFTPADGWDNIVIR